MPSPDTCLAPAPERDAAASPATAPDACAGPGRLDFTLGILNGVLGDYLQRRGNGLATEMGLVAGNRPVPLEPGALRQAYPRATGRLTLWVHGLATNEGVWDFPDARGVSYGALLERECGYTPLALRYNSGLHISANGESLAALLEQLVARFPVPVEELVLVGYSMGGLVIRSACHVAAGAGHAWLSRVRHAVYIGVPHLGAPLELLGKGVAWLLRTLPNPYTRLVADVLDLRSSGVKDLGFGHLRREDWAGDPREALPQQQRHPLPLLPGIAHHLIVGTLGRDERHVLTLLFGDGMVRLASAAGRAGARGTSPLVPREDVRVVAGVGHLQLAHHPAVYSRLRACLQGEA